MYPRTPNAPHERLMRKAKMEEYLREEYLREEFLYPYPHP
jgi:hypothetical protein